MSKIDDEVSNIPVFILASGRSERFGSPKATAKLGSKTLLEIVHSLLVGQTNGPIIVNSSSEFSTSFDSIYVADKRGPGFGPLAGIHSAMNWARQNNFSNVATVPVDTPFLPVTLLSKLMSAGAPAFAESRGRKHPVIGVWDVADIENLELSLDARRFSVHEWLERSSANAVKFDCTEGIDPFFNINEPVDLAVAKRHMHGS